MNSRGLEILGSRYRIVRPLGGGGMKSVYLAEDLKLNNRLCAVAAMIDNFASPNEQQAAVAAFQREADMLAALRNEHIPQIYDKFSEQQSHYLVMEFVEGDTLESRIRKAGKLSELEAIDIAMQILDTLEYLHGLNPPVIYRDMKPSNVMTTADRKVKLIDFGIARFFQTGTMTTMGTPGYSPPEQYGGTVEERSDLYALAATLHEALTGRTPVPFDFPPLNQLQPGTNQDLSDLLQQALSERVEDRVPNAREFRNRLSAIKAELTGALRGFMQPLGQNDRTGSLRSVTTQSDGQTWVFTDTARISAANSQSGALAAHSGGSRGLYQNISPSRSLRSSRGLANNRASVPPFAAQSAGSGYIAFDEEQTEVLARRPANSSRMAVSVGRPNQHSWVFQGASGELPKGRRSALKMFVGLASIAAIAFAGAAGINQWNEIQREKALIIAHQAFEQRQQLALQEAERQREVLVQQAAQREQSLRRQQQREAALERRQWRIQQAQQRASYAQAEPQQPEPAQGEAQPGSDLGQVFAQSVVGAMGETVGGAIGQALVGGLSGSGRNH